MIDDFDFTPPCETFFRTIREAVQSFTEYSEGDHTEIKHSDGKHIFWSRELYSDGEYVDVTVLIRGK